MIKLEADFKMRGFSYGNRNARSPQNRGSGSLRTGSRRGSEGTVRCRVLLARAAFQFSWRGMQQRNAICRIEIRWGDNLLCSRNIFAEHWGGMMHLPRAILEQKRRVTKDATIQGLFGAPNGRSILTPESEISGWLLMLQMALVFLCFSD